MRMNTRLLRRFLPLAIVTLVACRESAERAAESGSNVETDCADVAVGASATLPAAADWRTKLLEFAEAEVKHPAWGLDHSKRNFAVSTQLARLEHLNVDEDVLFAAALLHDLGGLPGHAQPGVDHAERSAAIAPAILLERGFPPEKVEAVKEVILAHRYYGSTTPTSPEAIVFHDADLLDFLGSIGLARLASTTGRDTPDLRSAVELAKNVRTAVVPKLVTRTAQCDGAKRAALFDEIQRNLSIETVNDAFY